MKKLFAFVVFSGLAGTAHAQTAIKMGTIQLGGNVGYTHTSVESPISVGTYYPVKATTINNQFTVAPAVGFL